MEQVPDSAGSSVTDSPFSPSGYSNWGSILANRPTFGTGINGSIHERTDGSPLTTMSAFHEG
jgi:hypothetical protein